MTHKTLPILLKALQAQAQSQNPPALGTLAVVCHMLCCLPAKLLGESNVRQMIPTLIAGLVYFSKNLQALTQSESISCKTSDVLSIILAALLKLLSISPEDVSIVPISAGVVYAMCLCLAHASYPLFKAFQIHWHHHS